MILEELETMTPMKDVKAKPIGIVKSCDHNASRGFFAKRAKSGSLTIKVAKLAIQSMIAAITAQTLVLPLIVEG